MAEHPPGWLDELVDERDGGGVMADRCCDESGCKRKQPMLVLPSGLLPGRWYVITRYVVRPGGDGQDQLESLQKHVLDEGATAMLNRSRAALDVLSELVRLKDGPRDDAYRAAKDAAWRRAREVLGDG